MCCVVLQGSGAALSLQLGKKTKKFVMLFGVITDVQAMDYGVQAFAPYANVNFEQQLQRLHEHELPKVPTMPEASMDYLVTIMEESMRVRTAMDTTKATSSQRYNKA